MLKEKGFVAILALLQRSSLDVGRKCANTNGKIAQGGNWSQIANFRFRGTYFFVRKVAKTSMEQVATSVQLVHSTFCKYTRTCLDCVECHICYGKCVCDHVSTINHDNHQCNS